MSRYWCTLLLIGIGLQVTSEAEGVELRLKVGEAQQGKFSNEINEYSKPREAYNAPEVAGEKGVAGAEATAQEDQQDGKIVNGTLADQGEFPYAVSKAYERSNASLNSTLSLYSSAITASCQDGRTLVWSNIVELPLGIDSGALCARLQAGAAECAIWQ